MRVLYCGAWQPRHHSDIYIAAAMEQHGWTVERIPWDVLPVYRPTEPPDLLFLGKPKFAASTAIRNLQRQYRNMRTALWWGDVRAEIPPTLADVLRCCDLVLPVHTGLFDALKAAGAARLAFWPLSAPSFYNWHVRAVPTMEADVAFLGNRWTDHQGHDDRLAMLRAVDDRFDLAVWGRGWEAMRLKRPMGYAALEDACRAIRSAKVVLGIQHYGDVALSQSQRTWNTLASGRCLLNRYVPDLELLFHDGVDMVFWRTTDELVERCQHLLSHEAERSAIAAAGHQYFQQHHTYNHRIASLALYLEGRSEGTPWEWTSFQ